MEKILKKNIYGICTGILILLSGLAHANGLNTLFDQVEKLRIERQGYVLGAILNQEQMKTAAANSVDAASNDTFKFKDDNVHVVAQKTSNRVLVIYEIFEDATQQKIQDLIGDLYMNFDEPTILAHDKVVYWAYGEKKKITAAEFDTARQNKKIPGIIATIKFISDINIMEKVKDVATGQAYYIISSDPLLEFFQK